MSAKIATATPSISDLRDAYRDSIASGTDAEHLAAKAALIEAGTGRTLSEEEKAYL